MALRIKLGLLTTVFATLALSSCSGGNSEASREPTAVDDAFKVCEAMKATGLVSECTVGGLSQMIDVRIDTTGAEARKICAQSSSMITQQSQRFAGNWELRIFSPFSGDHPLAVCTIM